MWECVRCTYINTDSKTKCSMCLKARPKTAGTTSPRRSPNTSPKSSPPKSSPQKSSPQKSPKSSPKKSPKSSPQKSPKSSPKKSSKSSPKKSPKSSPKKSPKTSIFKLPSVYQILPDPRFARPGLFVHQTLLKKGKQRLDFYGLFTSERIPKGAFVGYYTGTFYDEVWDDEDREEVANPPPRSHYAVNGSGFTVVPDGEKDPRGVDPSLHPLAMMNEPPRGSVSNVFVVEWSHAKDAIPGIAPNTKVGVIAMHACRDIEAGEELYFYYGDLYDRRHYGRRPYNVGAECRPLSTREIPEHERPRNVMLDNNVNSVPEDFVYISFSP